MTANVVKLAGVRPAVAQSGDPDAIWREACCKFLFAWFNRAPEGVLDSLAREMRRAHWDTLRHPTIDGYVACVPSVPREVKAI